MQRLSIRLFVSILTFTAGVALVWLQLWPRFETALVNRWSVAHSGDVNPVRLIDVDAEANEIYRLLIRRELSSDKEARRIVLRSNTTTWQPDDVTIKEILPEVEAQTIDNYLEKNKSPHKLSVSDLGTPSVLIADPDFPNDLEGFWALFNEKYR